MKVLMLFSVVLLSACSVFDNEQSISDADVIATANEPLFSVLNKSEKPILYLVIETNLASVIDLADPCADFSPNLEARSSSQLSYSDIAGWEEGAESVWFMWTDCRGSGDSKTIKL